MKPEALETWTNLNYPPPGERGCDNCTNLLMDGHPQCEFMHHSEPDKRCYITNNKDHPTAWKWNRKI